MGLRLEAQKGRRKDSAFHAAPDNRRPPEVERGGVIPRGTAVGSWGLSGRSDRVDPYWGLDDACYRLMPSGPTRPIPARHVTRDDWPEDARVGGVRKGGQTRQRLPRTQVKIQDVHQAPAGIRNVHDWDEDHGVRGNLQEDQRMGLGDWTQNPQRRFDVSRYPSLSPQRRPVGRTIPDDDEDSDFEPARPSRRDVGYPDRRAKKPKAPTRDRKEMKLEKFDGKTRIESFLAKFEICSQHNHMVGVRQIESITSSVL